jgi:hypothetical protein
LSKTDRHLYSFSSTGIALVTKKEGRCISEKGLASVNRLKQDQPMNTKKLICVLAGAALLLSCVGCPTTPTTPQARPNPTPRPRPTPRLPWGKRTEANGKVIGLTSTQITLQTSPGGPIIIISRSDSCLQITGSLAVGNTVTIIFCMPASCCPGFPVTSASIALATREA